MTQPIIALAEKLQSYLAKALVQSGQPGQPKERQEMPNASAKTREGSGRFATALTFSAAAALLVLWGACGIVETPHVVGALADDSCLQCHQNGEHGTSAVDHPDRIHCVSCHNVNNLRLVPHGLDMSDCLSCHQQATSAAPVTSHPERPQCERCHASSQ